MLLCFSHSSRLAKLYIPFWIYSNKWLESDPMVLVDFTFHSGYILMVNKNLKHERGTKLYIPFWIYSNTGKFPAPVIIIDFTFHSGYILMYEI